ncbi:MAG: hypothetical protein V4490_03820 [Pseudomonadota bacterium]
MSLKSRKKVFYGHGDRVSSMPVLLGTGPANVAIIQGAKKTLATSSPFNKGSQILVYDFQNAPADFTTRLTSHCVESKHQ